ncbi:hypothetical protein [Streptomyces sp. NPDC051636]|uniref:hypothetical protein n=1 Tax=Streptomyces sp. NPDC051636 TaxID=3365663 RepID=UPI00379FEB32
MTDTEEHRRTGPAPNAAPLVRRGRHRKPRPRKAVLTAGGLALAAGALSLVRLAPEAGVGAPGAAKTEPRLGSGGATQRSANTAATVGTVPSEVASATAPMGGVNAIPKTSAVSPTALPGGTAVPASVPATTIPATLPQATDPPAPSATTAPAPDPARTPAPAPSPSTAAPAPQPGRPGSVCVPVIGLCVDRDPD